MEFFTIGVYGSTEQSFFGQLTDNEIDAFCDIRQRRGVRGVKYAFVNSNCLQARLRDLGIRYSHVLDLAPTTKIRALQKVADAQQGESKRDREKLGCVFTIAYKDRILNKFDFDSFIEKLDDIDAKRIVLFCVEKNAEACHRSIVCNKLERLGYKITHL
ncbi:MAG: DUF488 family protein [Bacteroidales bacterium]